MADNLTKEQRSYCMSRIKRSNTAPELKARSRFRYFRYQPKNTFGRPDYMHKGKKVVVFIDGCFWHKCSKHFKSPKSNKKYWEGKIQKNIDRAKKYNKQLKKEGWKVIRIWEHELK